MGLIVSAPMVLSIHKLFSWLYRWGSWLLVALLGATTTILCILRIKKPEPKAPSIPDLQVAVEEEITKKEWEAQKQADANAVNIVEDAAQDRADATKAIEHDTQTVGDDGDAVNEYLKDVSAGQR